MKPFVVFLQLKEDSPPHLFISQIKEMILKDNYLSKDMKNLLLYLKKTKQSYIPLSESQELVIDFENFRSFQRGVKPQISAWVRKEMDDKEKEDYQINPKKYLKEVLEMYKAWGYEIIHNHEVEKDFVESLVKVTEPSKGRNKMRFMRK